jgi:L-lactate dehydrogenase complex protein LldG
MSDARTAILERIKKSLADVPAVETSADVSVVRDYLTIDPSTREEIIEQFVERVTEYRAKVHRVGAGELGQAIASACSLRGVKTLVVPIDLPEEWIPPDILILRDELLANEQLNNSDGVLTGCALGIAQTGTIVLDRGAYQGRRALTLLPDYHLCVVFEKQVVGMVPEAVEALRVVAGAQGRAMTWISGPSATSDIELNRVEGVHGPRTLEVLVVGSD